MNKAERIKMVKAMEFIARQVNDEEEFELWLSLGVADGDIEYGDLGVELDGRDKDLEYYTEDDNFADLMRVFLKIMFWARKDGGLYCDGVLSADD